MATSAPVELFADCAFCQLENGALERYDRAEPACRLGVPAETRCRLCGAAGKGRLDRPLPPNRNLTAVPANECPVCAARLDPKALDAHRCRACNTEAFVEQTAPPRPLGLRGALEAQLEQWAREDGFSSVEELLKAFFVTPSVLEILRRLHAGEKLETVVDPFAMAYGGGGSVSTGGTTQIARRKSEPFLPRISQIALAAIPPRAFVWPLVSICAADGEIDPRERAFVNQLLASEGQPPLEDHEFKVHAPGEVSPFIPRARRAELVERMVETSLIDGIPDGSELRVCHAYASAWGVSHEQVEAWAEQYQQKHVSRSRLLFTQLRHYLLVGAWQPRREDEPEEVEEQKAIVR